MSKKKNAGPRNAIKSGSGTKGPAEVIVEAWARAFRSAFQHAGKPLLEPAQQLILEATARIRPLLCEKIDADRGARGEKPIYDGAKISKWKEDCEKAYFGKLRCSEEGRKAFDFLRAWRAARIAEKEGGSSGTRGDSRRIAQLLAQLEDVLDNLDADKLELLSQAMRIFATRVRSSKQTNIGDADLHLEKWLLEFRLTIPTTGPGYLTAHELNEQFVSKFRKISDKKLRDKCNALGILLKPDKRGQASDKYGSETRAREKEEARAAKRGWLG
jgi:hypothetical protein